MRLSILDHPSTVSRPTPAMKALAWIIVLQLTIVSGCAGLGTGNAPAVIDSSNTQRLYNRVWELSSIVMDGRHVIMHVDAKMTLGFSADGQVIGFGSVNKFSGRYAFDTNGGLSWLPRRFATERKSGPPELMDKEQAFLEALSKTTRAVEGRRGLVLQSEDGSTVLSFTQARH